MLAILTKISILGTTAGPGVTSFKLTLVNKGFHVCDDVWDEVAGNASFMMGSDRLVVATSGTPFIRFFSPGMSKGSNVETSILPGDHCKNPRTLRGVFSPAPNTIATITQAGQIHIYDTHKIASPQCLVACPIPGVGDLVACHGKSEQLVCITGDGEIVSIRLQGDYLAALIKSYPLLVRDTTMAWHCSDASQIAVNPTAELHL
ncbi:hypothetical protein DL93DRAFT_2087902 [Clavulina sp. PMI_390]|nr:hypothetical protein DL93DRAFT_2087902 [Clavulina sp. PMI_390]